MSFRVFPDAQAAQELRGRKGKNCKLLSRVLAGIGRTQRLTIVATPFIEPPLSNWISGWKMRRAVVPEQTQRGDRGYASVSWLT